MQHLIKKTGVEKLLSRVTQILWNSTLVLTILLYYLSWLVMILVVWIFIVTFRKFTEWIDKMRKSLTLQQLYGGILPQYEELEFFKKVKVYVDDLWEEFNNSGQVIVPISGYCFKKDKLENMNPQKLLNYLIQNLETSFNINIMWDIFKVLKGKKTKLILYVYDSFLFDWVDSDDVAR
jgi:hypothetical protein